MAVYAAQIDRMDHGIGKVMSTLKDSRPGKTTRWSCSCPITAAAPKRSCPTGAASCSRRRPATAGQRRVGNLPSVNPGPDDVFQSNGLPWGNASNTPFRLFKHWVHQGGVATPLIAYWPKEIAKASITDQPGHVIDLMATCLDLAGTHVSRRSSRIASWCRWRARACCRSCKASHGPATRRSSGNTKATAPSAGVHGSWSRPTPAHGSLYDLDKDRCELSNLAGRHPDLVQTMTRRYEDWAKQVGVAPWDEIDPMAKK